MKYDPHKSSLFDLDANIAALLIYLIPLLIGFVSDSLNSIAWLIPLLAYIFEKESSFVIFHASTALSFCLIKAIIYFLTIFMSFSTIIGTSVSSILLEGIFAGGFFGIIIMVILFTFLIINFIILVLTIIAMIKAYSYQEINIPIINKITQFIINLKR